MPSLRLTFPESSTGRPSGPCQKFRRSRPIAVYVGGLLPTGVSISPKRRGGNSFVKRKETTQFKARRIQACVRETVEKEEGFFCCLG